MQSIDRSDEHSSRMAVQRALDSLQSFKGNSEVQREEKLVAEPLYLISTNKLSLARKVMGTQSFMRARNASCAIRRVEMTYDLHAHLLLANLQQLAVRRHTSRDPVGLMTVRQAIR